MNRISLFALSLSLFATPLFSDSCQTGTCGTDSKVCGKVEISPLYVHVDLLDNGKTVDHMDMPGVRGDACYAIWNGLTIKPNVMWARNDKELVMGGIGLGQLIPINDQWIITPVVGVSYTWLQTNAGIPQLGLFDLTQSFRGWAPYVGTEITWNFRPKWRIYGMVQYAWTRNRASFSGVPSDLKQYVPTLKERSQGWNTALLIERDINECWSVNAGGAYNSSYSKEKRGMRAYGFKMGLVRWF